MPDFKIGDRVEWEEDGYDCSGTIRNPADLLDKPEGQWIDRRSEAELS